MGYAFIMTGKTREKGKAIFSLFLCEDVAGQWGLRGCSHRRPWLNLGTGYHEGPWLPAGKNSRAGRSNGQAGTEGGAQAIESVVPLTRRERPRCGVVRFYELGNFIG